MKIPTLLAFFILFLLALGGFAYHLYSLQTQQSIWRMYQPQNIHILPISPSDAIITWESEATASGSVILSTSSTFDSFLVSLQKVTIFKATDQRDSRTNGQRTHYIQLTNLSPNTTYYFKMQTGSEIYPDHPLTFQTRSSDTQTTLWKNAQPLTGTVLNEDNHPVTDALVFLYVENKPVLATTTTQTGGFILPLTPLANILSTHDKTPLTGTMVVTNSKQHAALPITLPTPNDLNAIVLGDN